MTGVSEMTSMIEIRKAGPADAELLVSLMAEMDDDPLQPAAYDTANMRETLAEMADFPDFKAYIVLEKGAAVGSFSLMVFASPSHQGARQALLDAVVISRARRGQGIGTAMIKSALDIA